MLQSLSHLILMDPVPQHDANAAPEAPLLRLLVGSETFRDTKHIVIWTMD
jgi:hypothetical protein